MNDSKVIHWNGAERRMPMAVSNFVNTVLSKQKTPRRHGCCHSEVCPLLFLSFRKAGPGWTNTYEPSSHLIYRCEMGVIVNFK